MTEHENRDEVLSLGISPARRLENIESALTRIDAKLDMRFDSVEARLTKVEQAQAGQSTTAEFVAAASKLASEAAAEAKKLSDEKDDKAKGLADEKTALAAGLATTAADKALVLADEQRKFDLLLTALSKRQDTSDRKFWTLAGIGTAAVFVSGVIGYFIH